MAEQSFLAKAGLRLGILGSAASLAIAAPLANGNYDPSCHSDAARIGWYFDRTVGAEKLGIVVGGVSGIVYTRSGSSVNFNMNIATCDFIVGDGTGTPQYVINGAAATNRFIYWQTGGLNRWAMGADNTPESGSSAGTNFTINAYSDAGAYLDSPITIVRETNGVVTFARPVFHGAGTFSSATVIAWQASCTWNNAATTFTAVLINVTDTLSNANSLLWDLQIGSSSRWNVGKTGVITSAAVDDLTGGQYTLGRTSTLTGNITDVSQMIVSTVINGAFTVTRYNYITIGNPTGSATVTDGCVLRFDAAAGTHKAVDSGTTKSTPGGVDAWMKINVNNAIRYMPLYLSKTA